ncbi:MAG: nuclear transport factor 2 family protein [Nevskiales bacterium]
MTDSLEQRIARLEAIEAIRAMKNRYLAACDAKDPNGMRACFADGKVHINYGVIGTFDNADDLKAIYSQMACHPHMVEMHHGSNPRIEIVDDKNAKGQWSLTYQLINTELNTLTQLGGEYEDEYQLTEDGWKMTATTFTVISTLAVQLSDENMQPLFAGRQMPMPG